MFFPYKLLHVFHCGLPFFQTHSLQNWLKVIFLIYYLFWSHLQQSTIRNSFYEINRSYQSKQFNYSFKVHESLFPHSWLPLKSELLTSHIQDKHLRSNCLQLILADNQMCSLHMQRFARYCSCGELTFSSY